MFVWTWQKMKDEYERRIEAQKETIDHLKEELNTAKSYLAAMKMDSALYNIESSDIVPNNRFMHLENNYFVERLLVEREGKYAILMVEGDQIKGPNVMNWVSSKEEVLAYMATHNYRLLKR